MGSAESINQLHRIMDEQVLAGRGRSTFNYFETIKSRVESELDLSWSEVESVAIEYWWELARIGAIALSACSQPGGVADYVLTKRGMELLGHHRESPHDPLNYLDRIQRMDGADEIALSYIEEALRAWASGLYRSTVVMAGCSFERITVLLGQSVAVAEIDPYSKRLARNLEKRGAMAVPIAQLFGDILNALKSDQVRPHLPGEIRGILDRKLGAVFDFARGVRNDAGHPSAESVSYESALAVLLLFPDFYSMVNDIRGVLKSLVEVERSDPEEL